MTQNGRQAVLDAANALAGKEGAAVEPFLPDVETQRNMLTNSRDGYRTEGYRYQMELAALKVQSKGEYVLLPQQNGEFRRVNRKERLRALTQNMNDSYAAAREFDRMLQELPEKEAAAPTEGAEE